jgi:nucleoside-diphosphate-sugar epimerase
MKILVTGGGGFLGRHIIARLLRDGHQVRSFQRTDHADLAQHGVEQVSGDIRNADALQVATRGMDVVIHTAAMAGVWGERKLYWDINYEGTLNLLKAMERNGLVNLVHCSTPSVVFNGSAFEGADESLPYGRNWLCDYAETKALAEEAALRWGREKGGRVIALRPHLIWGPGDPHLLPRVIERAKSGRLRRVGDLQNRVDVTRVENAAEAHVAALYALGKESALNRPYFISQGDPVNLWQWINSVLEAVGANPSHKQISFANAYRMGTVCEWLWRTLRLRSLPPMTRFVAVELAKSHWYSIAAAREQLGYYPERFPMREGIERYAQAHRSGKHMRIDLSR